MFYWFEPVLYVDPVARFPETTEKNKPGFFVGFADNVGDVLTFKILNNDLSGVLHRSVVRSVADPIHRNKRVTFKPDTQEVLEKLDTITGATTRNDNQSKQRSRKSNDDVFIRTRSKSRNMNQNIGDRTRSKLQLIQKSGHQSNIFPLHDAVKFEDNRREQEVDLKLELIECRAYQSIILEPKLQCQLDHLRHLHVLDNDEDSQAKTWDCIRVLNYAEERIADDDVDHRCLVEWNDLISHNHGSTSLHYVLATLHLLYPLPRNTNY
jgi:hypothetical protein